MILNKLIIVTIIDFTICCFITLILDSADISQDLLLGSCTSCSYGCCMNAGYSLILHSVSTLECSMDGSPIFGHGSSKITMSKI